MSAQLRYSAIAFLIALSPAALATDDNICDGQGGSEIWIENARDTLATTAAQSFTFWLSEPDGSYIIPQRGDFDTVVVESDTSRHDRRCDLIVGLKQIEQAKVDVDYAAFDGTPVNINIQFDDVHYVIGMTDIVGPADSFLPFTGDGGVWDSRQCGRLDQDY